MVATDPLRRAIDAKTRDPSLRMETLALAERLQADDPLGYWLPRIGASGTIAVGLACLFMALWIAIVAARTGPGRSKRAGPRRT